MAKPKTMKSMIMGEEPDVPVELLRGNRWRTVGKAENDLVEGEFGRKPTNEAADARPRARAMERADNEESAADERIEYAGDDPGSRVVEVDLSSLAPELREQLLQAMGK